MLSTPFSRDILLTFQSPFTKLVAMIKKYILTFFSFLSCLFGSSESQGATLIIVRHAERSDGVGPNVLLTKDGENRAAKLAEILKDSGINHIITTEMKRTQQTAEPSAKRLGIQPIIISAYQTKALVEQLKTFKTSDKVLVVGHNNTVPMMIRELGGPDISIDDSEYSFMFIVNLQDKNQFNLLKLHY